MRRLAIMAVPVRNAGVRPYAFHWQVIWCDFQIQTLGFLAVACHLIALHSMSNVFGEIIGVDVAEPYAPETEALPIWPRYRDP